MNICILLLVFSYRGALELSSWLVGGCGWNNLLYNASELLAATVLLKSPEILVMEMGEVVNPPFDRAERGDVARTWSVPAVTGWLAEKKSMTSGALRAWLLGLL